MNCQFGSPIKSLSTQFYYENTYIRYTCQLLLSVYEKMEITILTSAIGELGHDVVERHLLSPAGGLGFRLDFLDVCREDPRGSHTSALLFQELYLS